MTEKPDTTEAVAEVIHDDEFEGQDELGHDIAIHLTGTEARELAGRVVDAHRKALQRAGWTEAPIVKINESDFENVLNRAQKRYGKHSMSPGAEVIAHLVELGLPIELEES